MRRHPWPVVTHFDWSLALVMAVEPERLRGLLYPGLELDMYEGQAFVAAALVQARKLRPTWAPAWMGADFFLSGWRIFVRGPLANGRRGRGLQILGSETDSWRMVVLGGMMTHYRYRYARIITERKEHELKISAQRPGGENILSVRADLRTATALPATSPFPDLKTARRFAGPMPFTFSYEPEADALLVVEGQRQHWEPRPVSVEIENLSFFMRPPFIEKGEPLRLANAFWVEGVEYAWKRGEMVSLAPHEGANISMEEDDDG
jgi:uncharacterized protein YqjF (DUF2071 family)